MVRMRVGDEDRVRPYGREKPLAVLPEVQEQPEPLPLDRKGRVAGVRRGLLVDVSLRPVEVEPHRSQLTSNGGDVFQADKLGP